MMKRIICAVFLLALAIAAKTQSPINVTYTIGLFAEDTDGTMKSSCDFIGVSEKSHVTLEITCDALPGCLITENSAGMETWSISTLANKCSVKWSTNAFIKTCPPGVYVNSIIQVKVTIVNPASPFYGRVGVMKYKLNNKTTSIFQTPPAGYEGGDVMDLTDTKATFYGMVLPAPKPTISVTGTALCAGATGATVAAKLENAPSGYTIDWGDANITTGASSATSATGNIGNLTATASGITAKLKNASGTVVATSAPYTVTVNSIPTATITAPAEFCEGGSLQLNGGFSGATGSATYAWEFSGTKSTTQNLSFSKTTASTATEYKLTVTVNKCPSEQVSKTLVRNAAPKVTLTAAETNKCAGKTVELTASASGGSGSGYSYTWTPTSLSGDKPTATLAKGNNNYSVTVKDNKNCVSEPASTTVTGYTVTTTLSANPASVIQGQTAVLTAGANGGVAPYTYKWEQFAGETGDRVTTPSLTSATDYKVKATDKNNCESAAWASVTVGIAGSSFAVNPPANMPSGYINTPFDAKVIASGGVGGYTYKWLTSDPTVTLQNKGDGTVSITSSTEGMKEVCVEVTSGTETIKKCFNVVVTDPSRIGLSMTVDKKCAYDGEFLTIIIRGSGADTYSFSLRDQSNKEVMKVVDKASWDPYKVFTDAAGTYKIVDFKYKISGVESVGDAVEPVVASFDPVPDVKANPDGLENIDHCEGEKLTLKGTGEPGLEYTWNNGVVDGVDFEIAVGGTYTVTGRNPITGCENTSSVTVNLSPRPVVVMPEAQEICVDELVTLTATSDDPDVTFAWNNGVINDQPFKPMLTAVYELNATNAKGCVLTDSVKVTVNQAPHIVDNSKNPRNIAIGKDAYFKVTVDAEATYQWFKKVGDDWTLLEDATSTMPIIIGANTDSISLLSVPKTWDGTELKVVATGLCGKDSMEFLLNVRECFEIEAELEMIAGIIPDEEPGNGIDGWYCRGQEISLKTVITAEEDYEIENAHYRWMIDGEDLAEEHIEMVSDTAVLTWIPSQAIENDFVVRVYAYCDGACEEVLTRRIRLKAREYEDVAVKIMTDRDPSDHFCAGDTVNFWLATKNVGETPQYTWYNDVFELPNQQSPYNELITLENDKVTLVMGQGDTWMRVVMMPSPEVCMREPMLSDSLFMQKKPWVEPTLSIDYADTMVCKGDTIPMWAVQANAGSEPTFQWQRSIGAPFPDWNLGTDYFATVFVDEEDVWVKCTMTPSKDVCYDKSEPIVAAVKISVFKEDPEVIITCDMGEKTAGEELVFEAEVKNILGEPLYEWYVDEMLAPVNEPEYVTDNLKQGSVVYCLVSGEKVCQTKVKSNEIIVDFGAVNRDTMLVIYRDERIKDLNMLKEGDVPSALIFMIETPANFGMASISPEGLFTYIPNAGFIGTDHVKYVILNRSDKSVVSEGYIYITVKESDRFFVPNLITPNDDGLNDTWVLDFLADYPNHLIQVFDRDGRIVFEARNYQNDWGGEGVTKSGYVGHINLVNGIYTYIIDLGDKDKTVLKSWIEIRANLNRGNYR